MCYSELMIKALFVFAFLSFLTLSATEKTVNLADLEKPYDTELLETAVLTCVKSHIRFFGGAYDMRLFAYCQEDLVAVYIELLKKRATNYAR